jgi:hypothetical protein
VAQTLSERALSQEDQKLLRPMTKWQATELANTCRRQVQSQPGAYQLPLKRDRVGSLYVPDAFGPQLGLE